MFWIALKLNGAKGFTLYQQRNRTHGKGMRRGKIHRLSQHQIFRLLHVRINRLVRLLGTSGQTSQGDRGAHQLHKSATGNRIYPLGSMLRKLAPQGILEIGRVGQLIDGAPVPFARHACQTRLGCLNQLGRF